MADVEYRVGDLLRRYPYDPTVTGSYTLHVREDYELQAGGGWAKVTRIAVTQPAALAEVMEARKKEQ